MFYADDRQQAKIDVPSAAVPIAACCCANHVLRKKMLWSIDHAEKVIVLLETLNPKSAHQ